MAAGGEHEEVLPVPLRRCTCLTHNVVSFPGEGRERPPRFYSTPLSVPASADRERRSFKLEGFGAGLTDRKPGRLSLSWPAKLWPVTSGRAPRRRAYVRRIPAHSRGPKFSAWDCKVTPAY